MIELIFIIIIIISIIAIATIKLPTQKDSFANKDLSIDTYKEYTNLWIKPTIK